jgi:hypothetical protein
MKRSTEILILGRPDFPAQCPICGSPTELEWRTVEDRLKVQVDQREKIIEGTTVTYYRNYDFKFTSPTSCSQCKGLWKEREKNLKTVEALVLGIPFLIVALGTVLIFFPGNRTQLGGVCVGGFVFGALAGLVCWVIYVVATHFINSSDDGTKQGGHLRKWRYFKRVHDDPEACLQYNGIAVVAISGKSRELRSGSYDTRDEAAIRSGSVVTAWQIRSPEYMERFRQMNQSKLYATP